MTICGEENVTSDELDLIAYTGDLASLPPLIKQLYQIKSPQYIIRPSTSEEISEIIKIATKYKIPFTSRAGASSGSGASIPVDGGIVFDLTKMDRVLEIDIDFHQVKVQPGITWSKLSLELVKYGYMTGIQPSSSPSATVGGFISNGGYAGIGAPKYGSIAVQIQKIKLILPNGQITEISSPLSSLFIGAEGTLGIISEINLRIYPQSQRIYPIALCFEDFESAITGLELTLQNGVRPYHSVIFDKYSLELLSTFTHEVPKRGYIVLLTLEGSETEVQHDLEKIRAIFSKENEFSEEFAQVEWENRFKSELIIKRAGPSLILLEIGATIKDTTQIYKTLQELAVKENLNIGFFGILGHGASILCMPFILTDERDGLDYLKQLLLSRTLLSHAIKMGGEPYGIGLWNTSFLTSLHTNEKMEIFRKIKLVLDEHNLSNPGKIVDDRTPKRMRSAIQ
jgi:glycolate oxidase